MGDYDAALGQARALRLPASTLTSRRARYLVDRALVEIAAGEMAPVLGIRGAPVLTRAYRWPLGTPQMEVGHLERMAALERRIAGIPGLHLAGAGLRVTGIPDSIGDGARVAEAAADGLR